MTSIISSRGRVSSQSLWRSALRSITTQTVVSHTPAPNLGSESSQPMTHYKVTLRRSAISLGDKIKGTLVSLGIHRRMQTVYHRHSPEAAGKILRVKELVEVHNVPESEVKSRHEQRQERKATRGYKVIGNTKDAFMRVGEWRS